ncbi:ArsR/SmtB family transcription factor [Pedobacter cryoconitis]|uniref:DNA-binding transcriptional ArsR family regulator n=1 Tax=Pedobacter cryoconitis TaxID=188932 RepID=A0A327SF97_9SPHI|nr:winged helix-turn-helix domain-containing protein [Pedobacter cryoconitis]RAJ27255.1 DNA-binding transcriptional ArsR family regulator [Pedobacter cryoconitis]
MELESLASIAGLIGEPARIKMLWAMMDGKAYTATELSIVAGVSPQSASMHLGKMVSADLLKVSNQGRHRYFSYAREEVAYAIEALSNLTPVQKQVTIPVHKDVPFEYCRTCYDHIAGRAGVLINDRLLALEYLTEKNQRYEMTAKGEVFFKDFGIDTDKLFKLKRPFARPCLDWSERRPHLAGSLAMVFLKKMIAEDWMRKIHDSRTLSITSKGQSSIYDLLGVKI